MSLTHQPVRLVPIRLLDPPRRRVDLETTPGRCANLDYCSLGMRRMLVHVPVGQTFACPECAGALRAPGHKAGFSVLGAMPWLRMTVLLGGMAAALTTGYTMGRVQPVVVQAVGSASRAAAAQVTAVRKSLTTTPPPPVVPEAASGPSAPALPLVVTGKPVPARLGSADSTAPAARLLHEQRYGRVVVDCTLGALVTRPVCHVADRRGGDAFSAGALVWLQDQAVQYAPGLARGSPAMADHRWRVVFEDFSGQEKRRLP